MENPKNIQISYELFFKTYLFLKSIDKNSLTEEMQKDYDFMLHGFCEKRSKIRNRMTYSEIVMAQNENERETAVNNYLSTKEMSIYL